MRSSSLLAVFVLACSHSAPPPASPEPAPASAPASLPASAPASAPSAATKPSLPPRNDLVGAITAGSGMEQPEGLDWGAEGEKPAKELFKNVQIFGDLTGNRMMAGMQGMEANLGKRCKLCHDTQHFQLDVKPEKTTARTMIKMAHQINHDFFRDKPRVSCFTCHRGHQTPPELDLAKVVPKKPTTPLPKLSKADAAKPADQVWKNIKIFKQMPAGKLPVVMGIFTYALGVECSFCHIEGQWASDDKDEKRRAREMLEMVMTIDNGYFPGKTKGNVGCYTCHQGSNEPARKAPRG